MLVAMPASAFIVDITTAGASGTIGDAYFVQIDEQSTGTGVIDPFLRIQHNRTEIGVNSDGPYAMNEKSGIWTHSILVSDFGVVDLNGVPSIRFMLDINQQNHKPLLSLDQLMLFVAPTKDYNSLGDLNTFGTLLYDMDMGGDNTVYMDYSLESGSGSGDMLAYLPYDIFESHTDQYLYLMSEFGATGGAYASNDGFEEWARVDGEPTDVIPEPASLLLLGSGLIGGYLVRRRRSA